jgi:hypothetical protein
MTPGLRVTLRSPVPFSRTVIRSESKSPNQRWNTSRSPPGDQATLPSSSVLYVTCRTPDPSAFITKIS